MRRRESWITFLSHLDANFDSGLFHLHFHSSSSAMEMDLRREENRGDKESSQTHLLLISHLNLASKKQKLLCTTGHRFPRGCKNVVQYHELGWDGWKSGCILFSKYLSEQDLLSISRRRKRMRRKSMRISRTERSENMKMYPFAHPKAISLSYPSGFAVSSRLPNSSERLKYYGTRSSSGSWWQSYHRPFHITGSIHICVFAAHNDHKHSSKSVIIQNSEFCRGQTASQADK